MAGELAGTPKLAVAQNLQIDNSAAARASAIAHAQKIRNLFPDIDAGAQPAPPVIPELGIDPDPSGAIATFQQTGPTITAGNAFFQNLETNGRTCFTCHQSDARTIAQATAGLLHAVLAPHRRDRDPLVEHLTYRCQIRARIADCTNQLERLRDRTLRKTIKRRQTLQQELAGLDKRLAKLVAEHDDWHVLEQRLRTVPGVGPVLVRTLIALLPELGQLSGRAIASLVGVAPFGRAISGAAAPPVREVLYMAALVAKRYNPLIAAFAKRLAGAR